MVLDGNVREIDRTMVGSDHSGEGIIAQCIPARIRQDKKCRRLVCRGTGECGLRNMEW